MHDLHVQRRPMVTDSPVYVHILAYARWIGERLSLHDHPGLIENDSVWQHIKHSMQHYTDTLHTLTSKGFCIWRIWRMWYARDAWVFITNIYNLVRSKRLQTNLQGHFLARLTTLRPTNPANLQPGDIQSHMHMQTWIQPCVCTCPPMGVMHDCEWEGLPAGVLQNRCGAKGMKSGSHRFGFAWNQALVDINFRSWWITKTRKWGDGMPHIRQLRPIDATNPW